MSRPLAVFTVLAAFALGACGGGSGPAGSAGSSDSTPHRGGTLTNPGRPPLRR